MVFVKIGDLKIDTTLAIATIDLAKDKNTVYVRHVQGKELKGIKFGHNRIGYQQMYEKVMKFAKDQGASTVVFGIESTSVYGIPLSHFLMNKPVKLVLINPLHTKRAKEINDNSPGKNDQKDPEVMADILQLGRYLTAVIPEGTIADLRNLIHARERAIQQLNILRNQMHDLIFLVFPEFISIIKNITSKTSLQLLKNEFFITGIVALGKEGLSDKIAEYSRGRMRQNKAEPLYEAALTSIGVHHGHSSIECEIKHLVVEFEHTQKYITETENKIKEHLSTVPYSKYLLSIPRLGVITVAGIIGELADFPNFETVGEVMKFAGLNLYEVSSGKNKSTCRISKRGRPLLRKFLYYAALNMIRTGGIFRTMYKEYVAQQRMKHPEAIVAIARKLLRIMMALVRKQCNYDFNFSASSKVLKAA